MSTEAVQNLTGTGYTETVELEGQRGLDASVRRRGGWRHYLIRCAHVAGLLLGLLVTQIGMGYMGRDTAHVLNGVALSGVVPLQAKGWWRRLARASRGRPSRREAREAIGAHEPQSH
jgi:hypothetical protein